MAEPDELLVLVKKMAEKSADALLVAAQRGDAAAVAKLLAASADPNSARDAQHKMPPISWAAVSDEEETIAVLLADCRTDASAESSHGLQPLHHAAAAGALRALSKLLAHGVSADAKNEWQETPLHLAAAAGHGRTAAALLSAGADANVRDRWDRTPAMAARQQGLEPESLGLPKLLAADEEAAKAAMARPQQGEKQAALVRELSRAVQLRTKDGALTIVNERHMFETASAAAPATPPPPSLKPPQAATVPPPPTTTTTPPPPPPPPPKPPKPLPAAGATSTAAVSGDFLSAVRARAAAECKKGWEKGWEKGWQKGQEEGGEEVGDAKVCAERAAATREQSGTVVATAEEPPPASAAPAAPAASQPASQPASLPAKPAAAPPRKPALSKLVEYPGDAAEIAELLGAGNVDPGGKVSADTWQLPPCHAPCPCPCPCPHPSAVVSLDPRLISLHLPLVSSGPLRTDGAAQVRRVGQARAVRAAAAAPRRRGCHCDVRCRQADGPARGR